MKKVLAGVILAVVLAGCDTSSPTENPEVVKWKTECTKRHGFISKHANFASITYRCVDAKPPLGDIET